MTSGDPDTCLLSSYWDDWTGSFSTVASVSMKLSPFWPVELQVWFTQVEAQFATHGVTSQKTMFDYIVASL